MRVLQADGIEASHHLAFWQKSYDLTQSASIFIAKIFIDYNEENGFGSDDLLLYIKFSLGGYF